MPNSPRWSHSHIAAILGSKAWTRYGKPEAYFRGRRLRGRLVRVPQGYRGVVMREGEGEAEGIAKGGAMDEDEDEKDNLMEEDKDEVVKALDEVAHFEELVVWGHETVPEDDNVFVKGMEEWIKFADAIHAGGNSKPLPSAPDENEETYSRRVE
ncbi:hypothetical protein MMC07_008083 [Pseudocyphellaria aurata]|nr:hypothetical protein [Pseudocyphellaria aurata]